MKYLWLFFLLIAVGAVNLDVDSYYTAPTVLQERGYLYVTFCSTSDTTQLFTFDPEDFLVTPDSISINFDGSVSVPDCEQLIVFASSDSPGMYTLKISAGGSDWVLPVEFHKTEPMSISLSRSVLYTGYDSVNLNVIGEGNDVWVTVNSSVVGANTLHASNFPASFPFTFYFTSPGFYNVPVAIRYNKNNSTLTQTYNLGVRVEEAPIEVSSELRVPSDGYVDLVVGMTLPEKIYSGTVTLSSECLSGATSARIEDFLSGNVTMRVKGDCDPGVYPLDIMVGDFETTVPLTLYGPEGYELFFNTFEKSGVHSLEVVIANEGSQSMKAISVRLLPGRYQIIKEGTFIGDLDFGDFDSAELKFVPKSRSVDLNVKITYTFGGEREEITTVYPYSFTSSSGNAWVFVILLLIGGGVWYAKRRKSRR